MSLNLSLKLNNIEVNGFENPIRIINPLLTLQWDFSDYREVVLDGYTGQGVDTNTFVQEYAEIKIGTSTNGIGTDDFVYDVGTYRVFGVAQKWVNNFENLNRDQILYGQVRAVSNTSLKTEWFTFSVNYPLKPSVYRAYILPVDASVDTKNYPLRPTGPYAPVRPTIHNDLILYYYIGEIDNVDYSGTLIRWFKNGIYQRQFDNSEKINSTHLRLGDRWSAKICPYDGYEYGVTFSVGTIEIVREIVDVRNVKVLPKYPNENDVLSVDYAIDYLSEGSEVSIRWYINDELFPEYNDIKSIRPDISVGDNVYASVKHSSSNTYISSSKRIIGYSDFVISDIKVDNKREPLDISSSVPTLSWRNFVPEGKDVNYVSIRIGSYYGADNIYSKTVSYGTEKFSIPFGTIKKGRDYYVSISASDTEVFDKYYYSHFRTIGSCWEMDSSNSKGWTLETLFFVESTASSNDFQVLKIDDGSKYAEIRIYKEKIVFVSTNRIEYSGCDNTKPSILTVAGKGNDVKIFLNKKLIIDATGLLTLSTTTSSTRKLELGYNGNNIKGFPVYYRYFVYSVDGYFLPHLSSEYADIQFHTFFEIEESSIEALDTLENGNKTFAVNPDNDNQNSSIYSFSDGEQIRYSAVNRTFSFINNITQSPDKTKAVFAHTKGFVRIDNYSISGNYDNELIFIDEYNGATNNYPEENGWESHIYNIENGSFFDTDGFHIRTTLSLPYQSEDGNIISSENISPFNFYVTTDMHEAVDNFTNILTEIGTDSGDFLITTGDICESDGLGIFADDFRNEIDSNLNFGENYRWIPCVGNHDITEFGDGGENNAIEWIKDEWSGENSTQREAIKDYAHAGPEATQGTQFYFFHNGIMFVIMNFYWDGTDSPDFYNVANTAGENGGIVADQQLEWLGGIFSQYKNTPKLIFGHGNAFGNTDRHNDVSGDGLDDSGDRTNVNAMWQLFIENNVIAYIHGHTHRPDIYYPPESAYIEDGAEDIFSPIPAINSGYVRPNASGEEYDTKSYMKVSVNESSIEFNIYEYDETMASWELGYAYNNSSTE